MQHPLLDRPATPYRWVIFAIMVLTVLAQMGMWLAPAALLTRIQSTLSIDAGAAGTLITVIPLVNGVFMFLGSLVIDRLGAKNAVILATSLLAIGGGLAFFAHSYSFILAARVLVGIGVGVGSPVMSTLVMSWFPPREQPYINTLVSVLGYVGMTLAFAAAVPLEEHFGSWQKALTIMAGVPLLAAICWVVLGANVPAPGVAHSAAGLPRQTENGIMQAARRKEIWYLVVAAIGQAWAFNTFTTFLPSFLQSERGFSAAHAGEVTGVLPLAGMLGGLVCGVASGAVGLRKPFLWPLMIVMFVSALVVVNVPPGPAVYLCIGLMGFVCGGWIAPLLTIPMELPGATPKLVGGAMALIFGIGFIISFFVSLAYGALVPHWGMTLTLNLFSCALALSIVSLLLVPETGPRATRHRPSLDLTIPGRLR